MNNFPNLPPRYGEKREISDAKSKKRIDMLAEFIKRNFSEQHKNYTLCVGGRVNTTIIEVAKWDDEICELLFGQYADYTLLCHLFEALKQLNVPNINFMRTEINREYNKKSGKQKTKIEAYITIGSTEKV